jgi:hypothetical protein
VPATQAPRRRGRAWLWLPIVGGLLALVLLAGVLLARDLLAVRQSLTAAQSSLAEVRTAAGAIDVDAASASLDRASRDLADARSRSGGPLWSLATHAPIVGDSVSITRGVVRVASAALVVAREAVEGGGQLVGPGLDVRVSDGRVDLGPLEQARQLLDGLPLAALVGARDDLHAIEPGWAPQELLDGRTETLRLADETILTVERGRELLTVLPSFLGMEGPRSYFLGVQTPAELRGTGGLIGFYAVLTVEDGGFEISPSEVYEALDGEDDEDGIDGAPNGADDGEDADAPGTATGRIGELQRGGESVRVDDEFHERYDHTAAAGFFHNVNVDPDLPTTAGVALDLFELRTGQQLDGLVLMDPLALELVLTAAGGAVDVPDVGVDGVVLPETITPSAFAEFITVDIYDQLGAERTEERKSLFQLLGDGAFAQVFQGEWEGAAMSRAIGEAAGSRHLQLFSRDEDEQAAFEELNVAGALQVPEGADLVAVTANNAVGGKQDVHLGHRVGIDVALEDPRRDGDEVTLLRQATVRTEVDNPLPSEGMDLYVIGNCLVGGERSACFEGPPGENRTWFSLWMPGGTDLVAERGDDGRFRAVSGSFRGLSVVDRYLETPPESSLGFELDLTGEAPARTEAGELVYELAWWEQSKAIPSLLDVRVAAPDGWRVADVEVIGGGTGRGFGVHGEGVVLETSIDEDGRAALTGTVSADTRLRVRMTGVDAD